MTVPANPRSDGIGLPTYRCPWCGAPCTRDPDDIPRPAYYCFEEDHRSVDDQD